MRDPSKLLSRKSPQYADWQRFLAKINAQAHSFNTKARSSAEAASHLVKLLDHVGATLVLTVRHHSSAIECSRELDGLVVELPKWFTQWVDAAALPKPTQAATSAVHRRLLRRAEYWKAKAHVASARLVEESPRQRAARRQRVVNPMMKKAGFTSDDAWAERAGPNIDRNTPRDYRSGKTKNLRRSTRQALAQALGIAEAELPL